MDLSKAMAEEKRLKDLEEKLEAERIQKEKAAEERRKAEEGPSFVCRSENATAGTSTLCLCC